MIPLALRAQRGNERRRLNRLFPKLDTRLLNVVCSLLFASTSLVNIACGQDKSSDLSNHSLEDLMSIQVTSVSKKDETLSQTAAAIFVITQEDIRRSGATNIPDLLRIVPGLDVAQINGSTWAISARGFNAQFSNKLLVMIDGRIVYTPNFAGVYWDAVDLPLEDIDRIEVIRGPGGASWGANAVNGVISIFTKSAADTHGGYIEASGGNVVGGTGTAEWSGRLGKKTDYRVYSKYFNQNQLQDISGHEGGADGWHMLRGGFRSDSALTNRDSLTVEGSLYSGREGELGYVLPAITYPIYVPVAEQIDLGGGFLQSAWNHKYSDHSEITLQAALTRYRRDDPEEPETRDTFDLDFQHHFSWGTRHDIVWGLGYRYTTDRIGQSLIVFFNPPSRQLQLFSGFAQDEFSLIPHRINVTFGAKLEHNDYTGLGLMPSARVAWTPTDRQTVWAAVSRALRTPSRNDTNLVVNVGSSADENGMLDLYRFIGNPNFKNERLIAYEAGYRASVGNNADVDLAAYYNQYGNLQTTEPAGALFEQSPAPPHEVLLSTYQNLMRGDTRGIEAFVDWQVNSRWTLNAGYALEQLHMHTSSSSMDTVTPLFIEQGAPRHSAELRSHVNLPWNLEWQSAAYFVDRLSHQGLTDDQVIPAYTRVDTGLTWKLRERFSISAMGQNLVSGHHLEFEDIFGAMQSGQMKRGAYARCAWQF